MKLISEKHPVTECFIWVLLAYLPVVSFQFAIKNDFFSAYFPLKYFISESINSGIFPLWNPFLNYGFPVYGDMSLAYWNPLTWLIASTVGYNPWSFTLEIILYLFIACKGMYSLSGLWMQTVRARQLAAVAFTCSGFFIGHLQHFNWITGAALLPFCFSSLVKFIRGGELKYFLGLVLSGCWLLTAAHPGIIIGALLFLVPLLVHLKLFHRKELLRISLTALTILLICGGMICAYLEVLPFTNRSETVGTLVTAEFSTGIRSWMSFLMSLPTTKADSFFGNDIAMRNCFFGILFFASLIIILKRKLKGPALYFLCSGVIFLFLSSELILPVYKFIPLVNYVRLNSEFRIFAILSFILAGGISLEFTISKKDNTLLRYLEIFRVLYTIATLSAVIYILVNGESFFASIAEAGNGRASIKAIIHELSFADSVAIHGTIQLIICSALIIALKQFDHRKIIIAGFAEIVIAALLNMPFTGVGQRSVRELDQIVSSAPKGVTPQEMIPEKNISAQYPETDLVLGPWSLYSKQIAMDSLFPYPLMFRSTLEFAKNEERRSVAALPPIFTISGSEIKENNISYSFQSISVRTNSSVYDNLVIKQNLYPKWMAKIDGKSVDIVSFNGTFMMVPIPAGEHLVELEFRNGTVKALLLTEFFLLLLTAIAWMISVKDQRIRYIFP